MGMDALSDLKEAKKEIEELIRTLEKIEHKTGLFQEKIKELGLTDRQISDIQNIFDDFAKV